MSLNRDQKRFVDLGRKLCGDDGWQRKFARIIGLSHQLVGQIASGERIVTDHVRDRVIFGLKAEVREARERAAEIAAALAQYEKG